MITLEQIADAILAYWLRHGRGPSADDIAVWLAATHHGADTKRVRAVLKKASPTGKLEDARVPGFETVLGNRHYHEPTTWIPTVALLRAQLRGEGRCEHDWLVKCNLMPLGGYAHTIVREYRVVTRTHKMALQCARDLATKDFPKGFHDNSSFDVEWLGKNFTPENSVPASLNCPKCQSTLWDPCGRGGKRCATCGNTWGAD